MHLSLHGCFGSTDYWPKEGTGLINYAASNNLILLFPMVHNCYDTKGNTGDKFATKKGIQPEAIFKMIKRVLEPRDTNFDYK